MEGLEIRNMPMPVPVDVQANVAANNASVESAAHVSAEAAAVLTDESAQVLSEAAAPVEILTQTLLSYGYKVTEENKAMLRLMLENGIPLTKENIQRMNQALKLNQTPEKALFMLQNNMRMTQANAAVLENLVSGQAKITEQINNLMTAVEQLDDKALAAQLKQILTEAAGTSQQAADAPPPQADNPPVQAQPQSAGQNVLQQAVEQSVQPRTEQLVQQQTEQPVQQQPVQTQAEQPVQAQAEQPVQQPVQAQAEQTVQQPVQAQAEQPVQQPVQAQAEQPVQQPVPAQAEQSVQQPVPAQAEQTVQPRNIPNSPAPEQEALQQPVSEAVVMQSHAAKRTVTRQTQPPQEQPSVLPEKLLFQLEKSTPETIDRYINNLREVIRQVQQALSDRDTPGTARVLQEVRTLESQIDFTAQIKNQYFVQLPVFHNGLQTLTNLHVYKDAKKTAGGGGEASSALIALETATMGHFETYVRKNSNAIACQFRLENEKIVKKVRDNIHKLDALLRDSGYTLEHFSFLPPGEPYTVLDKPTENPASPMGEIPRFDKKV